MTFVRVALSGNQNFKKKKKPNPRAQENNFISRRPNNFLKKMKIKKKLQPYYYVNPWDFRNCRSSQF